jgi:two-component system OmpR family response regulator
MSLTFDQKKKYSRGTMPPRVLLVDDDAEFLSYLACACRTGGFDTKSASRPERALDLIRQEPFDLALLDAHLGEFDGKGLCKTLKSESRRPGLRVIIMTADLDPRQECAALNGCGADDFMQKVGTTDEPVSALRLLARLRKHLVSNERHILCAGPLSLDLESRQASLLASPLQAPLSPRLFALLKFFLERQDQVLAKDELLASAWRGESDSPNAVEKEIGRLRELLGDTKHEIIRTIPGAGYLLRTQTPADVPRREHD